jgi:hypothetical protein
MKYAVEMGSGIIVYIPSFINIGSVIQKLIGRIHRQHGDLISLLLFFQNRIQFYMNFFSIRLIFFEIKGKDYERNILPVHCYYLYGNKYFNTINHYQQQQIL